MITRFKIAKLKELTEAVGVKLDIASEVLRTVQDRNKETTHKIMRSGAERTIPESALWDEVYQLGPAAVDAHRILGAKYPEVFEAYKAQADAADELRAFCIKELGMDYTKMSISNYIELTEGMFHLMFEEMKKDLLVELRMTLQTEEEAKK